VDRAYVCNLCLSIFRDRPPAGTPCPTCEATILVGKRRRS
jgi:DNA-directed RNA polymerase subunit RPC12/RpoP